MNFNEIRTVDFNEDSSAILAIDQTLLPGRLEIVELRTPGQFHDAISRLVVRGAPAIGVAAAMSLYLCVRESCAGTTGDFLGELKSYRDYLASSRPTAVNLFWALDEMMNAVRLSGSDSIHDMKKVLYETVCRIRDDDIESCRRIGEYGAGLIKDGDGILTHCNAGRLATVLYGTALSPIYAAASQGKNIKVYADETRPLLQGSRLTAFELHASGIDTTVICDNMAATLMSMGKIQLVIVGADRIAANGDTANKIGTLQVAIMAKHFNIPFYVAAPHSTIDKDTPDGSHIVIEERKPEEVTSMWYKEPMAPEGVSVFNPAFDVTPHELITGIITEKGILDNF